MGSPTRRVVSVDISPMNRARWCLTLACGHETWVTAARKPKTKEAECPRCANLAKRDGGK